MEIMNFITAWEMAKVAEARAAMRQNVPNTETFEKCYAKVIEGALGGQKSIDFFIADNEVAQYQEACLILSHMSYSSYIYPKDEYNAQAKVYIGWNR